MDRRLTLYILIGMVLGVAVGQVLHLSLDPAVIKESIAPWLKLLSDIFLNLIKLLVAPLVLSTIVVGIAHMGDSTALGRIGFRAITWFITASLISIGLGLVMVNLFQPGVRGPKPTFQRFAEGTRAFATDTNNWAPSLGLNWTPDVKSGLLHAILGEPGDTSLRAAFPDVEDCSTDSVKATCGLFCTAPHWSNTLRPVLSPTIARPALPNLSIANCALLAGSFIF